MRNIEKLITVAFIAVTVSCAGIAFFVAAAEPFKGLLVVYLVLIEAGAILFYAICMGTLRTCRNLSDKLDLLKTGAIHGVFEKVSRKTNPLNLMGDIPSSFRQLFEERYFKQDIDRRVKIQHLQNQINPHFIYNTLEGIRAKALIENQEEIAEMVENLGLFLRYNNGRMDEMVPLGQEIQNLQRYISIQQYRFAGKICFSIETEHRDLFRRMMIPKLTLQPIVENSIFHGLERTTNGGSITMTMEATDANVRICISDNGIGINEDELIRINARLTHQRDSSELPSGSGETGIALTNINERIKLFFGDDYGIVLHSTQGIGTDVYIKFPLPYYNDNLVAEDE